MSLALLAESSPAGRDRAYNIIASLCRMRNENAVVGCPNAFVRFSVSREHDALQPWAP